MITPKRAARIMKEGVSNQTGGPIDKLKIRTIFPVSARLVSAQNVMVRTWLPVSRYRLVSLLVSSQHSLSVSQVHS